MTTSAERCSPRDIGLAAQHSTVAGGLPCGYRARDEDRARDEEGLGQGSARSEPAGLELPPILELPPSLVPTLPREAYTSPERFAVEQERIFGRNWVCVGRSDDIPNPGDFLQAEVAGEPILVVRDRGGSLSALVNVCRHRGARICTEASGTFGKAIRCPYHAWTYGLDGHLISAPNMADMADLDRERFGLHHLAIEQWGGYVWVTLAPQRGSLEEAIVPQLRWRLGDETLLGYYGLEDLAVGARITYDVASNWKAVVENFMECYHCASIHPELTAAIPEFTSGYGTVSGGVGHGAALAEEVDAFSLSSRAMRPSLPGLPPEAARLFFAVVLRPNAFVVLVPDHVAFFRLEPLAPGRTRVIVDWLFDRAELEKPGTDVSDAVALLDITNRQDFDACERHYLGAGSRFQAGVLVPAEHVITDFYAWVLRELGEEPEPCWPQLSPDDLQRPARTTAQA